MLEILFFALLAGYLFFRLWGVLGDRTGFEKPRTMQDAEIVPKKEVADNVVVLPNRRISITEKSVIAMGATFKDDLLLLQEKEPAFQISEFLENAADAFMLITQAFVEGDKDTLKILLTEKTYYQFCDVIDKRQENGQRATNDILGKVEVELQEMRLTPKEAYITVKLTSNQRFITYNAEGVILDNPEEIATKMVNYWTFTRTLGEKDATWYLCHTRVDA